MLQACALSPILHKIVIAFVVLVDVQKDGLNFHHSGRNAEQSTHWIICLSIDWSPEHYLSNSLFYTGMIYLGPLFIHPSSSARPGFCCGGSSFRDVCPDHHTRKESWRHPDQMPEPPHLAPSFSPYL